jgi:anti-sigma-K factor RskA
MNYLQPERLDRLAREYALGTLAGPARRRFDHVLRDAPRAAAAVAAWQERLTVLAAAVPGLEPRPAVWNALQQRLFAAPARPGAWQMMWDWMSGKALAGALAGVLLSAVVLRMDPSLVGLETRTETLPASYVGLLVDANGKAAVLASSRRHGRVLTVKLLAPLAVPAGHEARLWALPKNGAAPFLVGVVPAQTSAAIALADTSEKLFFNVAQLALSVEPAGSAAAAPATPYVASGHCVKLW